MGTIRNRLQSMKLVYWGKEESHEEKPFILDEDVGSHFYIVKK